MSLIEGKLYRAISWIKVAPDGHVPGMIVPGMTHPYEVQWTYLHDTDIFMFIGMSGQGVPRILFNDKIFQIHDPVGPGRPDEYSIIKRVL